MRFSLLQSLREIPLAFVDVETTGASAEWGDRVIEIGVVRMEGGVKVGEYQQLIDPQRRIGAGVQALTGITPEMVAGQPVFADQLPRLMPLLEGAAVLGHNIRFDLSFLASEFRRARSDISEVLGDVPVLDTVRIARRMFGRGGNGLQILSRRLGVTPTVAHRALADAQTTALVFDKLLEPIGGLSLSLLDGFQRQGGPMGLRPANPRESLLPLELQEALEQRGAVMMEYVDARAARTHRIIEPMEVRRFKGELILVAHCQLRNDRRTFKLDRIVQLTKVPEGITAPADCSPLEGGEGEIRNPKTEIRNGEDAGGERQKDEGGRQKGEEDAEVVALPLPGVGEMGETRPKGESDAGPAGAPGAQSCDRGDVGRGDVTSGDAARVDA